jgi:CheY-like chemotaxis protein/two-component sensor histidine kinase
VLIANQLRDVTHRRAGVQMREREKDFAERVNATKSRFLAAASHDLRQPLQSLGFYVSLLQRETDDPNVSTLTEKMTRPLESMGQILDSLLDISELESGAIRTAKRPVRLQALVDAAYEDNIRQATDKGLALWKTPTDCITHTDPLLLQRALANLVSNAIQHSRSGSVTIRCVRGKGTVRMEVSDTGPGISADNLERIFEERYQVDNPEHDRRKGMGLGLAIVKHLAALLGHRLCVVSIVGQGSVFAIEMPLVETMEALAPLATPVSAARHDRQPLVLFVDDDPGMIDATTRVLATAGVRIQSALSGEEALALVRAGVRPDVLITDYRLPGCTGVELVRRLRDVTSRALPSIILTGDTSTKAIETASLTNCTLLHKPVDSDALLSCIAAC